MKKRLRKMILICPFLVSLTAMSTKDLKDTQMDLPEKNGQGVQIDIDLSTGDIHDKKPEKIESQDRGEGETVGPGLDIQEILQQNQASYEHIKKLKEKIDSLKAEIIRINSSNQRLQINYNTEKNRARELESEIIRIKKSYEKAESKPEQEVLTLNLADEEHSEDTLKKDEPVTFNIREEKDYIKLQNRYDAAKNRVVEMELDEDKDSTALKNEYESAKKQIHEMEIKIIELEKSHEENRNKYEQAILSLKQIIEGNSKITSRLSGTASRLSGTSNKLSRLAEDEQLALRQEPPAGYQEPLAGYQGPPAGDLAFAGEIFFESGKTDINPAGEAVLKQLGSTLLKNPDKIIRIAGHTDNVKIGPVLRARYFTNWDLAARRAAGVALYLQNEFGIDPHRITVVSYAQFRPAVSNSTEEARARNRRVEIFIGFGDNSDHD